MSISRMIAYPENCSNEARSITTHSIGAGLEQMMFSLLIHRELVDGPGFWVAALLFLAAIAVVLYIVGKWLRELFSRGKGR